MLLTIRRSRPRGSFLSTLVSEHEAKEFEQHARALEHRYDRDLEADLPFIVRLDGVSFRRLTARLDKPFDKGFLSAMLKTSFDLLDYTPARTVYCQSDEISLVFAPGAAADHAMPYSGRIQKLISVYSGFASARFTHHLQSLVPSGPSSIGWFDARAFSAEGPESAAKALLWRHRHDCRRNAVNSAGAANFPHNDLQGLGLAEVIQKLRDEKGIDFYSAYPPEAVYGVFLKRRQVAHVGLNPITGQKCPTVRTRPEARSFDLKATLPLGTVAELLLAKYWQDSHPLSLASPTDCPVPPL